MNHESDKTCWHIQHPNSHYCGCRAELSSEQPVRQNMLTWHIRHPNSLQITSQYCGCRVDLGTAEQAVRQNMCSCLTSWLFFGFSFSPHTPPLKNMLTHTASKFFTDHKPINIVDAELTWAMSAEQPVRQNMCSCLTSPWLVPWSIYIEYIVDAELTCETKHVQLPNFPEQDRGREGTGGRTGSSYFDGFFFTILYNNQKSKKIR